MLTAATVPSTTESACMRILDPDSTDKGPHASVPNSHLCGMRLLNSSTSPACISAVTASLSKSTPRSDTAAASSMRRYLQGGTAPTAHAAAHQANSQGQTGLGRSCTTQRARSYAVYACGNSSHKPAQQPLTGCPHQVSPTAPVCAAVLPLLWPPASSCMQPLPTLTSNRGIQAVTCVHRTHQVVAAARVVYICGMCCSSTCAEDMFLVLAAVPDRVYSWFLTCSVLQLSGWQ